MTLPLGPQTKRHNARPGIGASGRGIDCFRIMRTFSSCGPVVSRIDLLKMTAASELRSLPRIPPLAGLKVPKTSRAWLPFTYDGAQLDERVPIPPPDQAPVARLRIVWKRSVRELACNLWAAIDGETRRVIRGIRWAVGLNLLALGLIGSAYLFELF